MKDFIEGSAFLLIVFLAIVLSKMIIMFFMI